MEDPFLLRRSVLLLGVVMGVLNSAGSQLAYLYGLRLSTPTNAATLHLAIPVWTTLMSILFKKEKPSVLKFIGILLAIGGALAMLELENLNFENETLIGNMLILAMTLLFSTYLVFTKQFSAGVGPFTTTVFMFAFGGIVALFLIPIPPIWKEFTSPVTDETWISVTMSIIFGTTIPYVLLTWCLQNSSAVLASIYTPMELVGTVVLSAIFLKDTMTWRQGVGVGGIFAGLVLVTIDKYREEKRALIPKAYEVIDDNEVEITEKQRLVKPQSV